ncbi:MAG TPA: DUF4252 domain-containing protein [Cyclobacteriaceae bacterium]|nr:DUF4252 domain-containing protein [Cyclobacteriaceae bacterium]
MKIFFFFALILLSRVLNAQTKTTEELDKKSEGLSLYFYKNTLRMLNQANNKDFDELIKDIEKMKFLMIDKAKSKFAESDYKKLKTGYQSESYEEMMTSRFQGKNFDVYIRQDNGRVKGTVIMASDSSNLYVLDILGRVALDKATSLFSTLNSSTDIGQRMKDFVSSDDKSKSKKKDHRVKID